jgi:thioredoxin 1
MRTWIITNWHVIAAIGLLATLAGWSLGRCPDACTAPVAPAPNLTPNTQQEAEEAMPTVTRTENSVEHANEANFDQLVLESESPVLVDFYADWCGPCRMIAPILNELAQEAPDARIVKVNVDENPQLAARYGIRAIPSLLVFKDGEVVDQQIGLANKEELRTMIGI